MSTRWDRKHDDFFILFYWSSGGVAPTSEQSETARVLVLSTRDHAASRRCGRHRKTDRSATESLARRVKIKIGPTGGHRAQNDPLSRRQFPRSRVITASPDRHRTCRPPAPRNARARLPASP